MARFLPRGQWLWIWVGSGVDLMLILILSDMNRIQYEEVLPVKSESLVLIQYFWLMIDLLTDTGIGNMAKTTLSLFFV
jgi:hypothetical protein